jgi:DNA primase
VLAEAGIELAGGLVRIPYRDVAGQTLFCKVFANSGRSWYDPGGINLVPFGLETLPAASWIAEESTLLVCEGESDALAAREHFQADGGELFWHAIALPGAGVWRREWRKWLVPFPVIYLLGDGDEPGRRMNTRIKLDVPWARPVWLPEGEDVRSLLQAQGRDGLLPHLQAAKWVAHQWAAFVLARDLDHCERLFREEVA